MYKNEETGIMRIAPHIKKSGLVMAWFDDKWILASFFKGNVVSTFI